MTARLCTSRLLCGTTATLSTWRIEGSVTEERNRLPDVLAVAVLGFGRQFAGGAAHIGNVQKTVGIAKTILLGVTTPRYI